jgi:hypothetical protein
MHGADFIIADTMDLWISIANERLHDVLKKIDLLVINDGEAKEFAKHHQPRRSRSPSFRKRAPASSS